METETTTKSCILPGMKKVRAEFLGMIKSKMTTEKVGIRELARIIGVSHPTVTEVVTYGNMPSFDTCMAFAKWLDIPKVSALRISGLLPANEDVDEWVEEQKHKLEQIPPEMRRTAAKAIEAFVEEEPKASSVRLRKTKSTAP